MRVVLGGDSETLFDEELDGTDSKFALLIVDFDLSFGVLVRHEHVLVEHGFHRRAALVDAAPRLDVALLLLLVFLDEFDGLFTDDQHLFKLHLLALVDGVEDRLDVVLDLSLGLFSALLVLEVDRRGDIIG